MELSAPILAACLWALAAAGTALLPMRLQYPPGVLLPILAPALIWWLWQVHGAWIGLAGLAAFLSMFRNPPIHFGRKALGLPVSRPDAEPKE